MIYTTAQIKDGTGFAPGARFEDYSDYNGWTNRETWAVSLYINNDQGWQERTLDVVRDADRHADTDDADYRARVAGDAIREDLDELFDYDTHDGILPRDLFVALLDIGSLYRVDWPAIGAHFLADVAEQDRYDADGNQITPAS